MLNLRSACSGVEGTTRDNFAADEETTRKIMDDLRELKKELFLEIKRRAHSPEVDPPVIKPVLSKKHLAVGGIFTGVDENVLNLIQQWSAHRAPTSVILSFLTPVS